LDIGTALETKSVEKSMSLFGGNPKISLKTSSKYFMTGWTSMFSTLSLATSSIWAAKIWHSFLKLFCSYIVEISLVATTFGMP
jgi:hypothetical protein